MAVTKANKKVILDTLAKAAKEKPTHVFVGFNKLTVANDTEMRRKLRAEGVTYKVAKKSLIAKAMKESGFSGEIPDMPGQVGIASGDETAPARVVYEFQKKFEKEKKVTILGGVFENTFLNMAGMTEIAAIPSRQVLLGQFVNLLNSPIQRFVVALDQVSKKKVA